MSELKPCPFCGGEAKLYSVGLTKIKLCAIACTKCKVQYPFVFADEDMAIETWNKRTETRGEEKTDGIYEVSGHCASCRFWMTTLSPEDRAEAARYENTDGVCDMFNEDGFSPNDYCSRWEAREEVADKENQIENCCKVIEKIEAFEERLKRVEKKAEDAYSLIIGHLPF